MSDIKLYQGDCIEVMKMLAEQNMKVDMILTDPPYGTTACKWDSIIPFEDMWGGVIVFPSLTLRLLCLERSRFLAY